MIRKVYYVLMGMALLLMVVSPAVAYPDCNELIRQGMTLQSRGPWRGN